MSDARTTAERLAAEYRARLARHRGRILPVRLLAARPRFFIALAAGALVGFLAPEAIGVVARALLGWNAAALCYLALVHYSTRDASRHRIRLEAQLLDDGRFFVLAFSIFAALAAIGAIVAELSAAKDLHGIFRASHLALAACTIVSSWFFIHTVFALHYAHEFYLERRLSGAAATGTTPRPRPGSRTIRAAA